MNGSVPQVAVNAAHAEWSRHVQEQKALSLVRDAWAAESLAAAGTARALSQAIRSGVGWSQLSEVVGLSEADARKRWPVER